jgi:uncharacterized membrane protein
LLPLYGVREIATGIGILSSSRPTGGLWARVAGDAMHLSMLAAVLNNRKNDRRRLAAATASVVGVTVLDVIGAWRLSRTPERLRSPEDHAMEAKSAVTIKRPVEEVYRYCRDFEKLAGIFEHVESVRVDGDGRSHWTMCGPAGSKVEWDAEIVEDVPNQVVAWRAVDGGMEGSGSLRFAPAPGGQGTEVAVNLVYEPPGGPIGEAFVKLLEGDPSEHVKEDLRRFKQVMEAGEVVRSEGNPLGARPLRMLRQRPAQPLS